jgi:hypothetical protein
MSPDTLPSFVPDATYLMRRLGTTRRAQELTASMQFDLARSPLSDDHLDEVIDAWGGNASSGGWGMAPLLNDLLSREPQRVPVSDLRKLQENLIVQGYAPPESEVSGAWDPVWSAAFRRLDRDAQDAQFAGHHPGAAPIEAGIRLISQTLPSRIWSNIVGAAKGFVEQAPETAERVGLLGGAAGGAAIGAVVAGPAGALVGGVAGGAIGFFGDLFGEDEGEPADQSGASRLIDALSPFEEYSAPGGGKAFLEDLGFVATAASIVSGARLAFSGVQAAVGGIQGAVAEGTPLLRATLARAPVETPGWMTRISAAALKPAIGAERVAKYVDWVKINGLMAQAGRPIVRLANGAYSGMARASVGVSLASGLGSPAGAYADQIRGLEGALSDRKLTALQRGGVEAEIDRLRQLQSREATTIERNIMETSPLPGWVDLSTLLLAPEKFLPVDFGRLASSVRGSLGETSLAPIANIVQREEHLPLRQAVGRARELLGEDELQQAATLTFLRRNFGIDMEAAKRVADLGMDGTEIAAAGTFTRARSSVIARLRREASEGGTEFGAGVMRWAEDEPVRFEGWLLDRSPTKLPDYLSAERLAQSVTADIRSGAAELPEGAIRGRMVANAEASFERTQAKARAAQLLEEAGRLERRARAATDPNVAVSATEQALALRAQADQIKANLPKLERIERTAENVVIVPERLDTPTSSDLTALADEYRRLRGDVMATQKAQELGGQTNAYLVARTRLAEFVDTRLSPLIPAELATAARKASPPLSVAEHLEARSHYAAQGIDLGQDVNARFEALGYKPVVTSGDVLFTSEMKELGKLAVVGDYTRRAAVFETLGLGLRKDSDESIYRLVEAHRVSELDQVMAEAGVPLRGAQAQAALYRTMSQEARRGAVRGPLQFTEQQGLRGLRLPKVDLRDLSPDEILAAFENVPHFNDETALAVYGALRRASAYGGEVSVMHPMDSLRSLGRALRINGLPGFADFIRTARIHNPDVLLPLSVLAGAGLGAAVGDEPSDILKGALGGLGVGFLGRAFTKNAYGYLPDKLAKLNTALRYSLSFTFDAGRYTEASSTMMARYGLPGVIRPRRYIASRGPLRSPYANGTVSGDEAWEHALRFADEINGTSGVGKIGLFRGIDDIDRRGSQVGLLGFAPRQHEAAYALLGYQRGWSTEQIREAISQVSRYGLGRTAAEKSANFVFFPFSFSKKYLSTLGDFLLQAPARALLLQEGMRRYHASSLDEKFHDLIENHLPLLDQLASVNNLVYGISPGRFFLEGILDRRSLGAVTQALASVLIPGGAATPLTQAAGGLGDLAVHAFVPVVITGESLDRAGGIDGFEDIIRRYVPLVREIDQYFVQGEGGTVTGGAVGQQITALTEGRTSYAQLSELLDAEREFKAGLGPISDALGYSSVDGFLSSDVGAGYRARYEQLREQLGRRYPTGERMLGSFESSAITDKRALLDLAGKADRSDAEDAILALAQIEESWRLIGDVLGLPAELRGALVGQRIRSEATKLVGDRRFAELYARFFERVYGPIRQVA